MKVTEETITPKRAQELLDRHWVKENQRRPSQSTVDDYARTMRAGQWMLTHQGIAIDDKGELIDGVQRLLAISQAGCPIRMLITRDVISNGASAKHGMFAIDAIDRGRNRDVGQQLQLRHGYTNGTSVAAAAWAVLGMACHSVGIAQGRSTTGKALHVLDAFGNEIVHCVGSKPNLPGLRQAAVLGGFAVAMRVFPTDVKAAYERFVSGEDLRRGDPVYCLRNFLLSAPGVTGGSSTINRLRATLQALQKVVAQEQLLAIKSNSELGLAFFADKQRPTLNKLLIACGYISSRS